MSKKTLLTCMLLCLVCSAAWAEKVTLSKAKQIASQFIKTGKSMSLVKSMAAAQDDEALPIYIFSRGEGEGFVIVSGDDALTPIIGYTEEGDYDPDNLPPFLQGMIEYYSKSAEQLWLGTTTPVANTPLKAGEENIPYMITTHWHQDWPYNNLCPIIPGTSTRSVAGCVGISASQIIYYWHKDLDDRTKYDTPTYNYGDAPVTESIPSGTPLKWDLMQDSYSSSAPDECTEAVATFIAVVGTSGYEDFGWETGGYLEEQPQMFSAQFGLNGGSCIWKESYSQSRWESMILEDLELGRPIMYAGYNASFDDGHAVVLDGYQAATGLYHFNFGWGTGYDGYFTVNDTNGMDGYNEDQGMVYHIYPRSPNVDVTFFVPDQFISRVDNTIKAKVTNNGTVTLNGFYLYCLTGSNTPSSSSASDSDTETVIAPGETANLTFTFQPSSTSTYTVYLTDASKTILARQEGITTEASVCDLTLNSMSIDSGGESETLTMGDETLEVQHVFNSKKANVTANFTNGTDATLCTPSVQGVIYKYTDGEFVQSTTKTKKTVTFEVGATEDIVFDLTSLTDGEIYKFALAGTASTNKSFDIHYATADTVVYFKLMGSNLALTSDDGTEAKVTGNYNGLAFSSLTGDSTISRYDMTEVVALSAPLEAANKNALFYADASQQVAGTNIVVDQVCDNLDLTPGYNFQPREDFHALSATYHATQSQGLYSTAILPFDAETPTGLFARKVNVIRTQYLNDVDSCNLEMKGGTPYIILAGEPVDISASNVDVSINTPSLATDTMRGTWVNMVATETQLVLDDASTQYFDTYTGNVIPALTAYLEYTRKVRVTSSEYSTKDSRARQLAEQIQTALAQYDLYTDVTSSYAQKTFMAVIDEAREVLRTQPSTSEQSAQISALEDAAAAYIASAEAEENGYADMTSHIANPSFEQGNVREWTTSGASASRITTSLSNYMAHADGNYVAYLPGGDGVEQTLTDIENGTYRLLVSVAADYGNHITIYTDSLELTVEATDFGPMYLEDAVIDDVVVSNNTLTIGAKGVEGWAKVDNFRLYQTDGPTTPVVSVPAAASEGPKGIYDLTGRRLNGTPTRGLYIIDGKKVIVQ